MKRIFENQRSIIIGSILLAIVLSIYVNFSNRNTTTNESVAAGVVTTKVVENVPIHIVDSSNQKYVSKLPETVNVTLTGPRNILAQLTATTLNVSTEDVGELDNINQTIQLVVQQLPDGVSAVIDPEQVDVSIDRKVSITRRVEVETNDNFVSDGYEVGNYIVSPDTVILTGSQEEISKVANVKASVIITEKLSATRVEENVPVVVTASDGQLLDVQVDRNVTVTMPVYRQGQKVPVVVTLAGQKDNYNYEVTGQTVNELTLLGASDVLNGITSISATANVENLTQTGTVTATVWVPIGVTISNPQEVNVSVTVSEKRE